MENDSQLLSGSSKTDSLNKSVAPSQVSSVGFNNLKKWSTNTTQNSETSATTIRTNPLTRLFTKNKSLTNVFLQQDSDLGDSLTNNSDDDTISTVESKRSIKSRFNIGKSKSKKSNKPDLTIQTGGHHGLKVSKKILSSSSLDDQTRIHRKNSASSPASTFHSLFHRAHSNSQPINETSPSSKDDSIQKRTTVSLSSSNSNSLVTDINFAMIYNFTNPDYSVDEVDGPGDHLSFFDIHKKMMVPTDQYLQNKLNHRYLPQTQEIGLGISSNDDFELANKSNDFSKTNAKFFNNLLNITRPVFVKSQQKRLQNGFLQPYIGYTIEDIANYIKENYISGTINSSTDPELSSPTRRFKVKPKVLVRSKTINSPDIYEADSFDKGNFDDFRLREISQDILAYFVKGLIILRKDCDQTPFKNTLMTTSLQEKNDHSIKIINDWAKIAAIWDYFNRKIRYFLLGIFQPLQKYFHETSVSSVSHTLELESILLVSFRDTIIIPSLIRRLNIINQISPQSFLAQEEQILKDNPKLLNNLINCFGVTSACIYSDEYIEDTSTSDLLRKMLVWLSQLRT